MSSTVIPQPVPAPLPVPRYAYKIVSEQPLDPLPAALPLSALDAKDGFIHLSTATQVPATATRFYAQYTKLWILRLELSMFDAVAKAEGKGEIIWEASGSHGVFPHLWYGKLGHEVVEKVSCYERRSEDESWDAVLVRLEY